MSDKEFWRQCVLTLLANVNVTENKTIGQVLTLAERATKAHSERPEDNNE